MSATDKRNVKHAILTFITVAAVVLLSACVPAEKKRSTGTVVDDQATEVRVIDNIFDDEKFGTQDHIKLEVHNGTVLLAGETTTADKKALATEIVSKTRGVTNVVNELAVMPAAGAGNRLDNSYITSKANSMLTIANPVEGVDATRIKVMTARKIVYLMGTVTREEGDKVADVVRNLNGVEKVVKVFDYVD